MLNKKVTGRRKNVHTVARNAVEKGLQYAYRDRSKRETLEHFGYSELTLELDYGMSYSEFMGKISDKGILLNRKTLADLAMNHPEAFKAVVDSVK